MKKIVFLSTIFILLGVHMNLQAQNSSRKILVAYFSCTGNTSSVALHITDALKADIYEIQPAIPYTTADLNWRDSSSRSSRENGNPSSRPEISGREEGLLFSLLERLLLSLQLRSAVVYGVTGCIS